MSAVFVVHEKELLDSFNRVSSSTTGNEWAIFEYENASSPVVTLGSEGEGGIRELIDSFDVTRVQYGFATFSSVGLTQRKVILIHWQGDSVPFQTLSTTAPNVSLVKDFVKRVNLTINARSPDDIDLEDIRGQLEKFGISQSSSSPGTASMFEIPAPVGTVYTPVKPNVDIDLQEREKFWKEQQQEEESRRREEAQKNEERQKQFLLERKRFETELHQNASKNTVPPPTAGPVPLSSSAAAIKKGTLVTGRTQLFEQKVQELVDTSKPVTSPKNFKYEVALAKPLAAPIRSDASGATSPTGPKPNDNIDTSPGLSPAQIRQQFSNPSTPTPPAPTTNGTANKPLSFANTNGNTPAVPATPPPPPPPVASEAPTAAGNRVVALWDYQAAESNEISFNPNDVITDVEQVFDGWWKGRAPDGKVGLFPSNFVKAL